MSDRSTARVEHGPASALASDQKPAYRAADGMGSAALSNGSRHRVGRRGLQRLRTTLSDRDLAILHDVARCRLMSGQQLRRLHFPLGAHATLPSAARSARRVLRRLVDLRVLTTLERRIGGVRAGSEGLVYGVGVVGRRLLKHGRSALQREPSLVSLQHTLEVAEWYVRLQMCPRDGTCQLLALEVEAEAWRRFIDLGGRQVLAPDLFVRLVVGHDELAWFIEVDMGTEHRQSVRRKAERYLAYYRSDEEQRRLGDFFPRVLWIVPNEIRAEALNAMLRRGQQSVSGLFVVSPATSAEAVLLGEGEGAL